MTEHTTRLAVFISGRGTGLQSLIDASRRGDLSAQIALVVSSKSKALGLQRAQDAGIETFVFRPKKYSTPEDAANDLLDRLSERNIDYLALAGYMKLLPVEIVRAYTDKIVNIHPALLPKFGGKGMYGMHVHEAVIAAGEKESGPTVHFVDEIYDNGRILEQVRIPVQDDDTPETLAERVLVEEHKLYPAVIEKLIRGEYEQDND